MRGRRGRRDGHGGRPQETEAEVGLLQPQVKERPGLPEAGIGKAAFGGSSILEFDPVILILDFWPPE